MPDNAVDPKKAVPIGWKEYKLGGFTFTTPQPPEAILQELAKTFYQALIQAGKYEAAKDVGPFAQEPGAMALAMWLSDEIKARQDAEVRLVLLQEKVESLAKAIEKLQGQPGKEESDGEGKGT